MFSYFHFCIVFLSFQCSLLPTVPTSWCLLACWGLQCSLTQGRVYLFSHIPLLPNSQCLYSPTSLCVPMLLSFVSYVLCFLFVCLFFKIEPSSNVPSVSDIDKAFSVIYAACAPELAPQTLYCLNSSCLNDRYRTRWFYYRNCQLMTR